MSDCFAQLESFAEEVAGARRSLASKYIPKQELGDEKEEKNSTLSGHPL